MAIIGKPTSAGDIFASSEEALKHGSPVIDIPVNDFVNSLEQPEIRQTLDDAKGRCAAETPVSPVA